MKDIYIKVKNVPDTFLPESIIGTIEREGSVVLIETEIGEEYLELIDLPDLLRRQRELCAEHSQLAWTCTKYNNILNAPSPLDDPGYQAKTVPYETEEKE